MNKKPLRSLDNLFAERIIPIAERVPFVHAFDDYEQAIKFAYDALPEDETITVQKRINELPIKGILEVEIDIERIKKEAEKNNLNTVDDHILFYRKENAERMKRFRDAMASPLRFSL